MKNITFLLFNIFFINCIYTSSIKEDYKFSPNYDNFFNLSDSELYDYISDYMSNIYFSGIGKNGGGMHIQDMFTLYLTLKIVKPTVVIESGVWGGLSTKLIRRTLGSDCVIICLDPLERNQYKDNNPNTKYYVGDEFIDFAKLNLSNYNNEKVMVFFDDHISCPQRLLESAEKNIKHIIFNDNGPTEEEPHVTIEHLMHKDARYPDLFNKLDFNKDTCSKLDHRFCPNLNKDHYIESKTLRETREIVLPLIKTYNLFPNFFSKSNTKKNTYFSKQSKKIYRKFYRQRHYYTYNTYIELK